MFCSVCGNPCGSGSALCPHCGAPLSDRPLSEATAPRHDVPPPTPTESWGPASRDELVCVFRPRDSAAQTVAESILRSAEVEFLTRGADLQELFGVGRFASGSSLVAGQVEILVRREDAEDAASMLANVGTGEGDGGASEAASDEEE